MSDQNQARKIVGWFIRLKNRRVSMVQSPNGDFHFHFKIYDPSVEGRRREKVRVTKIALSDEAMGAMASLYLERGKSIVKAG